MLLYIGPGIGLAAIVVIAIVLLILIVSLVIAITRFVKQFLIRVKMKKN